MTHLAAVTGGTGFIGRATVAALADAGWRLRLLARQARPTTLASDNAELILGDLSQDRALERLVAGATLVVHLAGSVRATTLDGFMATNLKGTERLCRAIAASAAPPRLIVISSLAARHPALSSYAASKHAAEDAVRHLLPGGDWVILRPPAVYGPGDRATLPLFKAVRLPVVPLPATPRSRISLIHVDDMAAAIAALAADTARGETFEVSDERPDGYSWHELIMALAAAVGGEPRLVPVPTVLLHIAALLSEGYGRLLGKGATFSRGKLREFLHPDWSSNVCRQPPAPLWSPTIPLATGLAHTVAWYRHVGWL